MKKSIRKLNDSLLREVCLKYASKTELAKHDGSVYQYIRVNKLFDKYCSHMPKIKQRKIVITPESIAKKSKLFSTRTEFNDKAGSYYAKACELNILDLVCSHMPKNVNSEKKQDSFKWNDVALGKETLKYSSRSELKKHSSGAYDAMVKSNSLDKYCSHMPIISSKSSGEAEIKDWIESLGIKTAKTKKQIHPLELDIFMSDTKIAIEYCGLYWHSDEHKSKNYHKNKLLKCREKGIRLITVYEDEWLQRKNQIKNYLLSIFNKNSLKIAARKCEILSVPKAIAKSFLEENHIQGSTSLEIAFGLYHDKDLVGLITGSKHHRNTKKNEFVLNRLAFKSNVTVQGGSSRLLSQLRNYAKSAGYSSIVSWSDNRWSEGNVYSKIGFRLEAELAEDYEYLVDRKRVSKQSCKKSTLLARGGVGQTEREMANFLGYRRIWDCGKKRWRLDIKG